nr:hypothetical protein CFP56_79510 [Quercus suber]
MASLLCTSKPRNDVLRWKWASELTTLSRHSLSTSRLPSACYAATVGLWAYERRSTSAIVHLRALVLLEGEGE